MSTILLRNGLVVPVVGRAFYGDVVVEADRIAHVAHGTSGHVHGQVVDCTGRIIMPGLVNAHLHPELHVLKGIVEELDLHDWDDAEHFDAALAFLSSERGRAVQHAAVHASIADCILSGTTCIATYGVTAGADEAASAVLSEMRLRGHVTIRDVAFTPVAGPVQPAHRLSPARMYRLHAEEALTPEELSTAAQAMRRGERLVMHAAETEHRLRLVIENFGTSTIRLLDRYGLLTERMLLSHAVHVDAEERQMLALNRVPVVSSPTAEMKLADGLAPIVDMLRLGVTVALGSDCAICNNSDDMFLEMRQLGLSQKLRYGAHAISAEQILLSATVHGARALGHEGEIGAIAEGMLADLILVDVNNPRMQPLIVTDSYDNVAANLVYGATGQDVTDVMCGGEWIVRERTLRAARAEDIWQALQTHAQELYDEIL
ncbi:MAG TPA: amidohydrolase family protein [Longimicrobiales bacterium]